jgi:ribonuclease HII
VIKGDEKVEEISLASIYAKEYRDGLMREYANIYPEYGFDSHVGYGTAKHYGAIKALGLSNIHRKTFLKNLSKE